VHKLLLHPAEPGRLYQQNHVGVYRSDDHGESWARIDKGLPSDFGFPLAVHPTKGDRCYVVPLEGGDYSFRATPGAIVVYRRDGKKWTALTQGLPAEHAYTGVKREGLAADALDPCGVYLGTSTGHLYASRDEGDSWREISANLPPILAVSVAVA